MKYVPLIVSVLLLFVVIVLLLHPVLAIPVGGTQSKAVSTTGPIPSGTTFGQTVPTSVSCTLNAAVVKQADGSQVAQLSPTYTPGANAQLMGIGDGPTAPSGAVLTEPLTAATTFTLVVATGDATSTCSTLATPTASAL